MQLVRIRRRVQEFNVALGGVTFVTVAWLSTLMRRSLVTLSITLVVTESWTGVPYAYASVEALPPLLAAKSTLPNVGMKQGRW